MSKITILCGISNSGKSTWAHKQWLNDPLNTIIINRDKVRELLFGFTEESIEHYYHRKDFGKLENEITYFETKLVKEAISLQKHVIIDAIHLKYSYVNKWLKLGLVDTTVRYFDISLEEALERNQKRHRQVLESVIKDQYERYEKLKKHV